MREEFAVPRGVGGGFGIKDGGGVVVGVEVRDEKEEEPDEEEEEV